MMDTLGAMGNFMRSITKRHIPVHYIVYLSFLTLQIAFLSIAFHMRVALKSQYLFVVSTKPFPANQNVKYGCFHYASNYSITFFGSASSMLALNIAFWRMPHVLMDSSSILIRVWAWFVRQHTITWTSFGQALWHHVASLDHTALIYNIFFYVTDY